MAEENRSPGRIHYRREMGERFVLIFLYDNPYLDAYNTYYGGLKTMMPWISQIPQALR
jgi:hypothetical protein